MAVGGEMSNFYSSLADPHFYLHHANLDPIWWDKLVDDILAYIFFLNAILPDSLDPPPCDDTVIFPSSYEMAVHCTRLSHDLGLFSTLLDCSNPSLLDFGSRINAVYLEDDEQRVQVGAGLHFDRLRTFNLRVSVSTWILCVRVFLYRYRALDFLRNAINSNSQSPSYGVCFYSRPSNRTKI